MSASVVDRPVEDQVVEDILSSSLDEPAALVLEGEAGIGKTTVWLAAAQRARERGFCVLSARGTVVESVLSHAAVADLLGSVEDSVLADLPAPQRRAVDRVLLRGDAHDGATDQRAVAAAFLSTIHHLAEHRNVLVAVDDLQWLDQSSVQVLSFAARRFPAHVALLGAARTDDERGDAASWLQLPSPDMLRRVRVRPLSVGGLQTVMIDRLGRSFPRPTMVRIHAISGGNPFYALELGRAVADGLAALDVELPHTLSELVRARTGTLDADVYEVLLATACLGTPSVEFVADALDTEPKHVIDLIGGAEEKGIVRVDGNHISFTHPLLAAGVYADAPATRRRVMHRRLAGIVEQPELKARHLAKAATSADPVTLQSLDVAAEAARTRGAPAAAAELLDLAIGLGGDTPQRRIRSAACHFDAGNTMQARTMLEQTIAGLSPGNVRAQALNQLAVVRLYDDFVEAARLFESALNEPQLDFSLRVQMLVALSYALVNAGQPEVAARTVESAADHAARLGDPRLLSHALSMRVMLRFLRGEGLDEDSLRRAVELEGGLAESPIAISPTVQHALFLAWTGRLDEGRAELQSVRRRCIERGEEAEAIFIAFQTVLIDAWRGDFAAATLAAEDAMEGALQQGGDLPLFIALTVRAMLAVYAGVEDQARRHIADALAVSQRAGSHRLAEWTITALGFLEVSLGNYEAALAALQPLLTVLRASPDSTEIIAASFLPDAVEAMVQLGRLAEAEPLVASLERNGSRHNRAWMLAVGARCRSMLLAAQGDLEAASQAAHRAMAEHARLPMPFERARTQLLLGQLQRRRHQRDAATASLREALAVFDELPAPLWAARARAALARTDVRPGRADELTVSEQRVAELAAAGMTNREVAAELFISPKTVEVNLSRIYRKLGIRSRAQLGRRLAELNG